jgi:hypothetical protein
MTEYVYILIEYEHNTFTYDGITESEMSAYKTYKGAEDHAKKLGLRIVEYPENPNKEATIEKLELYP